MFPSSLDVHLCWLEDDPFALVCLQIPAVIDGTLLDVSYYLELP